MCGCVDGYVWVCGVVVGNGYGWKRERHDRHVLHFSGSFWAQVGLEDFLQANSGANVQLQSLATTSHFRVGVNALHGGRHVVCLVCV